MLTTLYSAWSKRTISGELNWNNIAVTDQGSVLTAGAPHLTPFHPLSPFLDNVFDVERLGGIMHLLEVRPHAATC